MTRRISGPALAKTNEDGRFYRWDFPWPAWVPGPALTQFWSVTTLINAGLPKWLHPWYAMMVANAILDLMESWGRKTVRTLIRHVAALGRAHVQAIQDDGGLTSIDAAKLTDRDFVYRWLTSAPVRFRDQKGVEGSDIHAEAEDLILSSIAKLVADGVIEDDRLYLPETIIPEYPAEITTRMQSFVEFVNDFRPRFLATETSVFSRHGYAGTLDAIVDIYVVPPGELTPRWVTVCVDWKSGKGIYEEVGLQLSAYARADFIGLPDGTALPLPKCEFAAVLHLTPKGYRFKWVDVSDAVYAVFLNVCEVGRFRLPTPDYPKGIASTVIGADILPIEEAA